MDIDMFGFQVNGSVVIPKLLNGRNKLFLLVSFKVMWQHSAVCEARVESVS
jgi:hypothetical protein